MMYVHSMPYAGARSLLPRAAHPGETYPDAEPIVLRHLVTPREIKAVLPLRQAIDLSAHAAAGDAFLSLEKKETN